MAPQYPPGPFRFSFLLFSLPHFTQFFIMNTPTYFGNSGLGRPLQAFLAFLTLFVGLGISPVRAQQTNSSITLDYRPTGQVTATSTRFSGRATDPEFRALPRLGDPASNPVVPNPNLGTFDFEGNSTITVSAAVIEAVEPTRSGNVPISARVQVRTSLIGSTPGDYSVIEVPLTGVNQFGEQRFSLAGATFDLLNASNIKSGGQFVSDIRFEVSFRNRDTGQITTQGVPSGSFQVEFTVTAPAVAPPGATTTWIGGRGTNNTPQAAGGPNDWRVAANWTNGVPNAASSAIIPSPPRPNPPILNDPAANYEVKDLTVEAANPSDAFSQRGILRITTARLKVYGNIRNGGNGILATTNAENTEIVPGSREAQIELAGADQTIDRGRFANVIISNNVVTTSGNTVTITPNTTPVTKSLFGVLDVPGELSFAPGVRATLRTTVTNDNGLAVLSTTGDQFVELGAVGAVLRETNFAFVLGVLKSTGRPVVVGVPNTFGNIGIDITIRTANATNGTASITRTTGTSFSPLRNPDGSIPEASARSIKRIFGNSFSFLQQGLTADVTIHYNDSDNFTEGQIDELNGNMSGRLQIFRTTSGSTFENLGGINRTPDERQPGAPAGVQIGEPAIRGFGGTVTQEGLNNINTVTLADRDRPLPLPVELALFDVKRSGSDAILTWTTATEKNNKGFNVQVSTDGKLFRTIGFVASANGTSARRQDYRFIDAEAGKTGTRYYRLHQVDLDGKSAISAVRVLKFSGAEASTTAAALLAYPNPFTDRLSVSIAGAGNGTATLRLTDLTGRTVKSQQVQLEGSSSTLDLNNLGNLSAGTYMVQLVLPSGKTQNFKVQKQ